MLNSHSRLVVFGVAALICAGGAAMAQERSVPSGSYAVKFEQVANSCADSDKGLALESGTLVVASKDNTVTLTVRPLPPMTGAARTGSKVRAASARSATSMRGVDGRFTAAGKVDRSRAQLVIIAEYFRGDRALCTQSWNVVGARR